MNPKVYIGTTIVSYFTAWPSRDVVRLSHELLTRDWWANERPRFDLYTSELTLREASAGDPTAAAERLKALDGLPLLGIDETVVQLGERLAMALGLPERARADAVHVALSAVHGIEFLLTWNCRHLANAVLAAKIEQACKAAGYVAPRIVTPEQLASVP